MGHTIEPVHSIHQQFKLYENLRKMFHNPEKYPWHQTGLDYDGTSHSFLLLYL